MKMPLNDQKRVNRQLGLISMQQIALSNFELDDDVKEEAIASLHSALQSPYEQSHGRTISVVGRLAAQT